MIKYSNYIYIFILFVSLLDISSSSKIYSTNERIPVFVSNVGPFNNPAETYDYYDKLPICVPKDHDNFQKRSFLQSIQGEQELISFYEINFLAEVSSKTLCSESSDSSLVSDLKKFATAIDQDYMFQFFIDDLPVEGYVGEYLSILVNNKNITRYYLYRHLHFSFLYTLENDNDKNNENLNNINEGHVDGRIVAINVTTFPSLLYSFELTPEFLDNPKNVEFSYSVHWTKYTGDIETIDRFSVHSLSYAHPTPLSVQVHWLSIFNTFVLVLLLTALLGVILLRVLKRDLDIDELQVGPTSADNNDDSGWKLIHDNVFRFPNYISLFAAMIGAGAQILGLTSILLISFVFNIFSNNRGHFYILLLFFYTIAALLGGYVSGSSYKQFGGTQWANNAILTSCIFILPSFGIFCIVNSVALSYGTTSSLPFSTVFILLLVWALFTFPLTIIGAIRGKNSIARFDAPCKTKVAQREIPSAALVWYRSIPVQMLMTGFLPFSAIYIEVHYIFAAVWGHHIYTFYGVLAIAFILLLIVTATLIVCLTYLQLAAEDWRWWWRSYITSGATGIFIFLYAIFYFHYRSAMSGVLQGTFFFGYMIIISYAFFLMLGAVGYYSSLRFIRYIYNSIKSE